MEYKIEKFPDKPFLKNEENTVGTHGTAVVTAIDDDGIETVMEFGMVTNEDIYLLIKKENEVIIDNCFVEEFLLVDYQRKEYCKKDAEIKIKRFSSHDSFFNGHTNFSTAQFMERVVFDRSIFFGNANFNKAQFGEKASFHSAKFFGDAFFNSAQFNGFAAFGGAQFSEVANFTKVKFIEYADFGSSKFFGSTSFYLNKFKRDANYHTAKFFENTNFNSGQFNGTTHWDKTEFIKATDFKNSYFEHPVNFSKLIFPELDLTGIVFEKYALFKNCTIEKGPRETFRIIKNEFLRTNNRIDSLEYHKKEMEAYRTELKETKWYRNFLDKIVLRFNKYTNCYGTNWLLPIAWTLGFAMAMFILLNIAVDISLENIEWRNFFKILSPTHRYDFMKENITLCFWSYFIDTLARLGIGLGYFQIIQAFRKFKIW